MHQEVRLLPSFNKEYDKLFDNERREVKAAIDKLTACIENNTPFPKGLGHQRYQPYSKGFSEIRAGRRNQVRVLFRREGNELQFHALGDHHVLERYVKNW